MLTVVQLQINQDYWLKLLSWCICTIWNNLITKVATTITILLQRLPACKNSWIFFLEIEVTIIQMSLFVQCSWLLQSWLKYLVHFFIIWDTLLSKMCHQYTKFKGLQHYLEKVGKDLCRAISMTVKCWFCTVSMKKDCSILRIINCLLFYQIRYLARVNSHKWILWRHSMHSTHRITFQTHRKCFRNGLRGKKTQRQPKTLMAMQFVTIRGKTMMVKGDNLFVLL